MHDVIGIISLIMEALSIAFDWLTAHTPLLIAVAIWVDVRWLIKRVNRLETRINNMMVVETTVWSTIRQIKSRGLVVPTGHQADSADTQ